MEDEWDEVLKEFWNKMREQVRKGEISPFARLEVIAVDMFVAFLKVKGLVLCGKEQESK